MLFKILKSCSVLFAIVFLGLRLQPSKIVFLNGCSSTGKTEIAKALQEEWLDGSPLRFGIDPFIYMMPGWTPPGSSAVKDFYSVVNCGVNAEGHVVAEWQEGSLGKKLFAKMPQVISLLAGPDGFNIVIDDVVLGDERIDLYLEAFKDHSVYFVKVFCDPEVMRRREVARGDRTIGLAQGQLDKVHAGTRCYDIEVDTTVDGPTSYAREILKFIAENPKPVGFAKMCESLHNKKALSDSTSV